MSDHLEQPDDWICVELSLACDKMVQALLKLIEAAGNRQPLLPCKFAIEEAAATVLMTPTNRSHRDKSAKDTSWDARMLALEFPDVVESIEKVNPLLIRLSGLTMKLKAHGECGNGWQSKPNSQSVVLQDRKRKEKRVTAEEKMRALYPKEPLSIDWTADEWAARIECDRSTIMKTRMWKETLPYDRELRRQASPVVRHKGKVN